MYKKLFKDTDQNISLLGLGCMRFPTKQIDGKDFIDKEKAQEIVDYAFENGINYFDTAYMYHDGLSEDFMGEALKKFPRDSFYLATKLPIWMADTAEDMERIFNEQLEKLQVEYFDFYLLHALGRGNFDKCLKFGAYEFLFKMKEKGIIKNLGFSFHDNVDVLQEIVDYYSWDFAQLQINYLDWDMQNSKRQYEILEEKGIPCIVMEPVRGGALANPCEKANELFKSARPNKSVASWAIRYVASLPNVMTVLSGMSNMEQIADNISTMTNFEPLTDDDRKVIEKAVEAYKKKDTVPCTGCRYCMDCPEGVDIPKMFKLYNEYAVNKDKDSYLSEYNQSPDSEKVDKCIACEKCTEHCPQAIEIPQKLEVIKELLAKLNK